MAHNYFSRSILHAFVICSVIGVLLSCRSKSDSDTAGNDSTNRQSQEDPTPTADTAKTAGFTSDDLYTLYITTPQLQKLLGGNGNDKQKLVFQFHRDAQGILRVLLIPCKLGNRDFILADAVLAERSNIITTTLSNTPVSFGNLQLLNNNSGTNIINELRKNIGKPGWEFIWLVPKKQSYSVGSLSVEYVVYTLSRNNVAPPAAVAPTELDAEANPSPPRTVE